MAFDTSITPGAPPLLWSNVNQAFKQINENFDILVATIGDGSGLTPINFETLDTSVSPTTTNTYTLGTITNQWKRVHTAEWQEAGDNTLNGIWLGSAQIKGKGLIVDLPVGSTVDGNLIIDPDKTFIKTIQVDGNKSLESDVYGFTANFTSGLGIALQVSSSSDEIEFSVDPTFDLTGSIYADDTTLLVDRLGYIRGNVNVAATWSVTADTSIWEFDQTGTLTFPSGATVKETGSEDIISGATTNDLVVSSDQNIKIVTDANSGIVTWTFKDTGEFVVPSSVDFEYGGIPTFNLSTTTTSGRVVGEINKTFSVVLTDGTDTHEWAYGIDGSLQFPLGQTIDSTGYTGDVNGLDVTADTFIVGTFSTSPASNYFQVEDTSTNRIRIGGPGQQTIELRSFFSPAANGDEGSEIVWRQSTAATDDHPMARIFSRVTDITNFVETGELIVNVTSNGSWVEAASFTEDGLVANVTGTLNGNVTGNVLGDLTGNVTGNVLGDLTGNVLGDLTGNVTGNVTSGLVTIVPDRVTTPEIEGVSDELAIYGNWAGLTGISIVSTTSLESVTIESDRIVTIGTDASGTRKDWIFETTGVLTLPAGGYIDGDTTGVHTGNIFTSLIDSSDSSAITITPVAIFNSDIQIENDVIIRGSKVLNLAEIKSIVADSTDFADFQARIAAL